MEEDEKVLTEEDRQIAIEKLKADLADRMTTFRITIPREHGTDYDLDVRGHYFEIDDEDALRIVIELPEYIVGGIFPFSTKLKTHVCAHLKANKWSDVIDLRHYVPPPDQDPFETEEPKPKRQIVIGGDKEKASKDEPIDAERFGVDPDPE